MSSIDSLLEQIINIKNISLSTTEYINLSTRQGNKENIILYNMVNSCYNKYSQESLLKETPFNNSLFFQCTASNICSHSFKEMIKCIQKKKKNISQDHNQNQIFGCENEYIRLSKCMDDRIDSFINGICFDDDEN